jgi:hypothetical protein
VSASLTHITCRGRPPFSAGYCFSSPLRARNPSRHSSSARGSHADGSSRLARCVRRGNSNLPRSTRCPWGSIRTGRRTGSRRGTCRTASRFLLPPVPRLQHTSFRPQQSLTDPVGQHLFRRGQQLASDPPGQQRGSPRLQHTPLRRHSVVPTGQTHCIRLAGSHVPSMRHRRCNSPVVRHTALGRGIGTARLGTFASSIDHRPAVVAVPRQLASMSSWAVNSASTDTDAEHVAGDGYGQARRGPHHAPAGSFDRDAFRDGVKPVRVHDPLPPEPAFVINRHQACWPVCRRTSLVNSAQPLPAATFSTVTSTAAASAVDAAAPPSEAALAAPARQTREQQSSSESHRSPVARNFRWSRSVLPAPRASRQEGR